MQKMRDCHAQSFCSENVRQFIICSTIVSLGSLCMVSTMKRATNYFASKTRKRSKKERWHVVFIKWHRKNRFRQSPSMRYRLISPFNTFFVIFYWGLCKDYSVFRFINNFIALIKYLKVLKNWKGKFSNIIFPGYWRNIVNYLSITVIWSPEHCLCPYQL